jgi:hypothetical protein
MMMDNRA